MRKCRVRKRTKTDFKKKLQNENFERRKRLLDPSVVFRIAALWKIDYGESGYVKPTDSSLRSESEMTKPVARYLSVAHGPALGGHNNHSGRYKPIRYSDARVKILKIFIGIRHCRSIRRRARSGLSTCAERYRVCGLPTPNYELRK